MTPNHAQTIHRYDRLLKRIDTGVERATVFLLIPAAMASHAHVSFAGWIIAPLLVAMALWTVLTILIAVGQRRGIVGKTLFSGASSSLDDVFEAPKREPPPVVRKADDTLPSDRVPITRGSRFQVLHIPGRGDVRYRIS